jgi:hypothetical protein
MTMAMVEFLAGYALAFVSGARLWVRAYKLVHERGRGAAFDPLYELIKHIKLTDTEILEMIGLIAGSAILQIAIRSL